MVICRLRSLVGSLTMGAFWRSILEPQLVVFDGHVWADGEWHLERVDGRLREVREDRCVACGASSRSTWRRWYGA